MSNYYLSSRLLSELFRVVVFHLYDVFIVL